MNMNFQRPHAFEAKFLSQEQIAAPAGPGKTSNRHRSLAPYAFATLVGCVVGYGLAHSSFTVFLVVAGALLTLAGLATAACIYAQNNSPW
jgi:hypothetical protein